MKFLMHSFDSNRPREARAAVKERSKRNCTQRCVFHRRKSIPGPVPFVSVYFNKSLSFVDC